MRKLEADLREISEFISSPKIQTPNIKNTNLQSCIKSSYKQFHALLVWGLVIREDEKENSELSLYFTECLSDISHSYLLNLYSLYKSSRSSLRSGIENAVRVVLLDKKESVTDVSSVYELFALLKKNYSDVHYKDPIYHLHQSYGELCKSVHSAKLNYLSQTIPFDNLSLLDEAEFISNNEMLRKSCSSLNQMLFLTWDTKLKLAGHANEDLVRDALPKGVKRIKT